MLRMLSPAGAFVLVLGLPPTGTAEEAGAADARLEAAGLADARVLPGIEIARVTGADGARYHVIRGLDRMGGMDEMMDRGDLAPPARIIPVAAESDAPAGAGEALDEAAEIGLPLDVLLPEAGFDDYVLLERAHVAEMSAAGGALLHILFGLEGEDDD
jgi:hypothetical protein